MVLSVRVICPVTSLMGNRLSLESESLDEQRCFKLDREDFLSTIDTLTILADTTPVGAAHFSLLPDRTLHDGRLLLSAVLIVLFLNTVVICVPLVSVVREMVFSLLLVSLGLLDLPLQQLPSLALIWRGAGLESS